MYLLQIDEFARIPWNQAWEMMLQWMAKVDLADDTVYEELTCQIDL